MEEEFSSGGDEGDFGGFALGPQALVKGFQDRVVPGGDKGGHPKTGAHGGAATGDVALAAQGAAVVVARGQAGQGGGLALVERAEFGQFGQEQGGGGRPDAAHGGELLHLGGQGRGLGDECRDGFFQAADAGVGEFDELLLAAAGQRLAGMLELVSQERAHGDQLLAGPHQVGQLLLGGAGRGAQARSVGRGKVHQHTRVDPIGLGQATLAAGKVAHPAGVDHAHREGVGQQARDHLTLVAAGSLQHDVGSRPEFAQPAHQPIQANRVAGEDGARPARGHVEPGLGHIDSDIGNDRLFERRFHD